MTLECRSSARMGWSEYLFSKGRVQTVHSTLVRFHAVSHPWAETQSPSPGCRNVAGDAGVPKLSEDCWGVLDNLFAGGLSDNPAGQALHRLLLREKIKVDAIFSHLDSEELRKTLACRSFVRTGWVKYLSFKGRVQTVHATLVPQFLIDGLRCKAPHLVSEGLRLTLGCRSSVRVIGRTFICQEVGVLSGK